jgi:hypothetical protein
MKCLLTITTLFICLQLSAQDKIIKKDKSVIDCKIVEIGLNEVKYLDPDLTDGPIISIGVEALTKIVLSNGREIEFKDPLNDPNSYAEDKKNAIKLHFLSPLFENLAFTYEHSLKPGRSYESEIGIIGLGFNTESDNTSSGVFISGGFKFMRTPDFYTQQFKYSHILKESYVKPQLLLSIYNNQYTPSYYTTTPNSLFSYKQDRNIVAGAFIINLGKQIVYDNFFLIDYSFGLGYGFSNQSQSNQENDNFRANHFGFLLAKNEFPIAVSFKVKIGFLL